MRPLPPIAGDETGFRDPVDVALERERRDVGFESVADRPGLRAAALIRFLEDDRATGLLFPELLEGGQDGVAVGLARGRVGGQNERVLRVARRRSVGGALPTAAGGYEECCEDEGGPDAAGQPITFAPGSLRRG
jgi:hypothetical protein